MTVVKGRPVPRPIFKKVEDLDRLRNMMLGLPVSRVRSTRDIPWGYRISDEDEWMLEPIDEHFELLVEAKHSLAECTYNELSDWLTVESGVSVSPEGVRKIMERRQPDDRAAWPREEREKV